MNPKQVGAAGIGTTIAGGILEAKGSAMSYDSQSRSLSYKAAIAELNQDIAKQNAGFAIAAGEGKALQYGLGARERMGKIRAGQGASGIDVGSGSAKAVQESQQLITEMDLRTIREEAAREAYGYELKAYESELEAEGYRAGVDDLQSAKGYAVAGSLIGTATSVADKWLHGRQQGMW